MKGRAELHHRADIVNTIQSAAVLAGAMRRRFGREQSALRTVVADISEAVGHISAQTDGALDLRLCRQNRIRTIQGSLAGVVRYFF